uniref:ER lumen protein-retaining receptor 2 n=1 Tax=Xenopus tropicalis TaxID=8364 RepID=A0A5S6LMT8_XENTR
MGKKRKSSVPNGESGLEEKKAKPMAVEFTGTHFKSLLKEPHTALKGLEQFINLARKLPSTDLYDVVEGYIKISVECVEILKLLEGEKRPESEIMLIFQALEAVLLRTASDLSHLNVAGVNIVKKMINTHMKLIYASVYSEIHRMSRICLNLLSAMVAQGPDCARDVFSHFDFHNKFLPTLLKRRDKQGRPDVRMAYIQFATSFFISGDNPTIIHILELNDFVGEIFATGIKEDRISTINLLLSLLKTKVVQNKAITKTQKVRFFTFTLLNHMASLYRWNGIVDVSTEDIKDIKDPQEAGKVMIRELVHNFLMDLCCSLKHGINFYDPSLGTAGRAGNLVLLRFLVALKTATEDELIGDLVVNILKVCPDLLSRYFKETQYSFVPRVKTAWLDNIKLLKKIYEAQPVISPAFRTTEFVPLPRLLSMLMITTVAPVCNKAMFTQGLNLPNKIVKHTILSLVCSILRRAELNISHCLREDIWQKSEIYTPATMTEFAQKYREALSKLLPDINTVVATWQSLSKGEGAETEGAKGNSTTPEEELPPAFQELPGTKEEHGSDDVQTTLLKASLLQVVCLYQKVVPHLVAQSSFDFSKLLKGIVNEKGVREEVPPVLQYQILQVSLALAGFANLLYLQETPDASGEKSVFYLLLKMFATCIKPQLKNSIRLLIVKVLRDSGVFEYTWQELDLWLRNLDKVTPDSKEAVIQFLEQVLVKLVSNPYPYTDKAAESVQEASMLQSSLSKQDSDTASIPISHIDDVMDMVDVIVEGSEGLDDEIGVTLDNDLILQTFPFSAAVPVALEIRNKLLATEEDEHDCVLQYLVSVLTDILHSQRDPLALCLLLQNCDKELKSLNKSSSHYSLIESFQKYYSLWIPSPSKEGQYQGHSTPQTDISLQNDVAYSSLLKKTFVDICTPESHTEELLNDAVDSLTIEQLPVAVKHTLLCLQSTVDNFNQFKKNVGASRLRFFLELLNCLLCRAETARVTDQGTAEESQKESELFIDTDPISILESSVNTVLEDILTVTFRHPSLENWFLALERRSVPSHSLNPVGVKQLSSCLNQGVIQLLKSSSPLLQEISSLPLASKYFEAISESILKELKLPSKATNKKSQALEALESLYMYMDTVQLNEIILAILKLPEEFLLVQKIQDKTGKQLSFYGKVLLQLLTESHQRKQPGETLASVVAHVRGVSSLLPSSGGEEMESVLYEALQGHTEFAHVVGVEILTYCLTRMSEISLCIAALLIQHSTTHLLHFEVWCLNPATEKHLKNNSEAYLPLISGYLKCRGNFQFARPSKISSAVLRVLKEAFWSKLLKVALSPDTQDGTDEQILVLSKLMETSDISDLQKCIDRLPEILAQSYSQPKWNLADAVLQAAETAGMEISSWMRALLAACMKCLTATYTANRECEKAKEEAEKAMLLHFKKLLPFVREDVPAEWNGLVKAGLKYRYKDCEFLDALNAAICQWYEPDGPSSQCLVPLPMVHMMLTQHSLFLPTLLRSQEEEGTATSHTQELLVDILRTIVKKCPSVCDGNHFAILLGAYGATLSATDQKILQLLQAYEKNNHSLTEFRLLLWGPAAVEHHKTRKTLGQSLWQQPSMEEILSLLDREKIMKTIFHFPQHRKLIAEGAKEILYEDSGIKDLDKLYDPCFLLPLFSELVRPELMVDCVKFVDTNALGLAMAALSSYDYNMRAAANYVLGSFLSHMEGARFRDKRQLQYLMDIVKNGIRQPNQRLTFLLPLYVAKASQQILKPEEHIYIKMSKFLLSHQYLDMKKVPDFYKLFYSFDFEHKVEREWILELLRDGMRDKYCYELCDNQRIFHVIMAYYNSPLSDETSQNLVLEILQNASHITKAAYQLIRDHSLLTWIIHILEKRYLENKLLANLISLIHNLWLTNLGKRVSSLANEAQDKDGEAKEQKFLPLHLVSEFVSVLVAMTRHIRSNLDFIHITQFFSTFSSVLRYRSKVLEAFKEMGRFAANEFLFSSQDALLILHKWSTIEKDLDLQERLSSLAQKHRIKELLSTIKEKYKPQIPHKLRKEVDAGVQSHIEVPQDLSALKATRHHVRSVLIHWEPVFLTSPLRLAKEQVEEGGHAQQAATDDCETQDKSIDSFVSAAACLIAKWILRTESADSPTLENVYTSLQWFQTSILPHGPVVEELLEDRVLRSSLYKLYSTVCNGMGPTNSSPDLLPLFNTVMGQLMNTQKLPADLCHEALKAVLLSPGEEDSMQKAVRNFLLSLYIQDIWLGADNLDMFRSHLNAVAQAVDLDFPTSKEKTPKGKKKKEERQEAIVSFCKDLSRALS